MKKKLPEFCSLLQSLNPFVRVYETYASVVTSNFLIIKITFQETLSLQNIV